ncbi:DUF1269 domain-containing protein [Nonomuraea africana]|uniref:DUF1269 domain-containing protein n=1 Tax=Nonomuraea africana TaxID=46171 RepID=UPI0021F379B2|nr:DUF1269 domain-containing protein [Nonomuraea africana]
MEMAVGAAAAAAAEATKDLGVNDASMRDLGQRPQPGGAALFLLVTQRTPGKVIIEIAPFGGEVMQTSLSAEAEADLREAVQHVQAAASAS